LKLQQQKLPTYIPMSRKSHKFAGLTAFSFMSILSFAYFHTYFSPKQKNFYFSNLHNVFVSYNNLIFVWITFREAVIWISCF